MINRSTSPTNYVSWVTSVIDMRRERTVYVSLMVEFLGSIGCPLGGSGRELGVGNATCVLVDAVLDMPGDTVQSASEGGSILGMLR